MAERINSISFHDNYLCWAELEVNSSQHINLVRVAESPLPFTLNYNTLKTGGSAGQAAQLLGELAEEHRFSAEESRFLLSARFGLIKKIMLDNTLSSVPLRDLIRYEMQETLTSAAEEFIFYQPDYRREWNAAPNALTIAFRKDVYNFFVLVGKKANLNVTEMNLNCFALDELVRRLFPNLIGQVLLVNFTDHGFELNISDEKGFLDYRFHPYSKSLESIESIDEAEVCESFGKMISSLLHPEAVDHSLYSISHLFVFGAAFKPGWLEKLQPYSETPIKILDPFESSEWQIGCEDAILRSLGASRFVEVLANVF